MPRTPLWRAIADTLRSEIAEGRYAPGDRLPTEADLAARFGVNRHTVRRAQSVLTEEGVIFTRRGSGAFVLAKPADYPLGRRVRFHQNLLAAGRRPERRVLSVETRPASVDEAEALTLAEGDPVCVYHAVSLADGQPLALATSLFPEARLPGLAAELAERASVTGALAAVGVADYTRASTRVQARAADATQALHLRVAEGAPVLYTTSLNVGPDGMPVEFGRTWFAGDRITLTLQGDGG